MISFLNLKTKATVCFVPKATVAILICSYSIFLRCWPIMKVSKVYSENWNQRY